MRAALPMLLLLGATSAGAARAEAPPGEVVSGQTTIRMPDTKAWSPTARRLLDLEIERSAAIARHDTAWLSNLYAPDFRGVVANGRQVDRDALMQVFSRDNPQSRFLIDELVVSDFGASATVMGRLRTTTLSGDVVAESRYLHVYVSRDQHWWIVAAAGSAVQNQQAPPPPPPRP